jgi:hypothetical protein
MRMGTHIRSLPGGDFRRSELVEEDERTDHLPLRRGQSAADLETALLPFQPVSQHSRRYLQDTETQAFFSLSVSLCLLTFLASARRH